MILEDDIAIRHVLVGTRPRRAVVVPRRKVHTGRDLDVVLARAERAFGCRPSELAIHQKKDELWIYPK